MAKSSALTRFAPRPIIVRMPRARRAARFARVVGRRVGRVARRAGRASLPSMLVAVGGLAAGYANGKGFLDKLPPIAGSRMVTIGLGGYALTRFTRSPALRAAGVAMLGAAAFAVGQAQATGGGGGATQGDGGAGESGGY